MSGQGCLLVTNILLNDSNLKQAGIFEKGNLDPKGKFVKFEQLSIVSPEFAFKTDT